MWRSLSHILSLWQAIYCGFGTFSGKTWLGLHINSSLEQFLSISRKHTVFNCLSRVALEPVNGFYLQLAYVVCRKVMFLVVSVCLGSRNVIRSDIFNLIYLETPRPRPWTCSKACSCLRLKGFLVFHLFSWIISSRYIVMSLSVVSFFLSLNTVRNRSIVSAGIMF